MADVVNHPSHYKGNGIEAIDVIEGFGLDFHLGNVVKYTLRAGRKTSGREAVKRFEDEIQDLSKARWYLDRRIATLKRAVSEFDRLDKLIERSNRRHLRRRGR